MSLPCHPGGTATTSSAVTWVSLHCWGSVPAMRRGLLLGLDPWVHVGSPGGTLRWGGVLPKGPQGSPSRLPSPRRWESELRLFSAESWSVLTKLCLQRDSPEP